MKLKQKMGKLLIIKFLVNNLKPMLFIVGFALTLWRANECVKKYLNNNISTKVSLVKSFQTVQPNFVICPSYLDAYNSVALTNVEFHQLQSIEMEIGLEIQQKMANLSIKM